MNININNIIIKVYKTNEFFVIPDYLWDNSVIIIYAVYVENVEPESERQTFRDFLDSLLDKILLFFERIAEFFSF